MIIYRCDVCSKEERAKIVQHGIRKPIGWMERDALGGGLAHVCSWECARDLRDQRLTRKILENESMRNVGAIQ